VFLTAAVSLEQNPPWGGVWRRQQSWLRQHGATQRYHSPCQLACPRLRQRERLAGRGVLAAAPSPPEPAARVLRGPLTRARGAPGADAGAGAGLPACGRPALLLAGRAGAGQGHLAPALLHALEALPVHAIGLPALLADASARRARAGLARGWRCAYARERAAGAPLALGAAARGCAVQGHSFSTLYQNRVG